MRPMSSFGLSIFPRPISGIRIAIDTAGTLTEASPAGTVVGEPVVLGAPAGTVYDFALIANSTGFVSFTGGQIVTTAALDYETLRAIPVTFRATPQAPTDQEILEQTVFINIRNVLEVTLVALGLSSTSVAEDIAAGALIANIQNTTAGAALSLTNDAEGRFAISGTTLVAGANGFDFESETSHEITIREKHPDSLERLNTFTITVTNVLEVSLNELSLSSASVAEDVSPGTLVGAIIGSTPGGTVTLIDDASGLFELSGSTILTAAALDFETATSHDITLRETHPDALDRDTTLTITVTDVVEDVWSITAGDGTATVVSSPSQPATPTVAAGDGTATVTN